MHKEMGMISLFLLLLLIWKGDSCIAVTSIEFSPTEDRYFLSGSLDAKVRLWSIPDHKVVDWSDTREMVTAARYSQDGSVCASPNTVFFRRAIELFIWGQRLRNISLISFCARFMNAL
jgi:WD40 repeat protein